jgi:hypothetical protein
VLRVVDYVNQRDYKVYADTRQTLTHLVGTLKAPKATDVPWSCRQCWAARRVILFPGDMTPRVCLASPVHIGVESGSDHNVVLGLTPIKIWSDHNVVLGLTPIKFSGLTTTLF